MRTMNYDVEGIFTINDVAAELYRYYVGGGYNVLSNWVVSLWGLRKNEAYRAGDTPRMILPLLLAHGVNNKKIEEFAEEEVNFISGAKKTLKHLIRQGYPSSMISVCFEPYMMAVCDLTGFPKKDVYCTKLPDMSKIKISEEERKLLRKYAREIERMEVPRWGNEAKGLDEVDIQHRDTIERLDQMYEKIKEMDSSRLIYDTEIVGGPAKVTAIGEFAGRHGSKISESCFLGDSIADNAALKESGLGITFNGNEEALSCADVAIIADDTLPSSVVTDVHQNKGKEAVMELAGDWDRIVLSRSLPDLGVSEDIAEKIYNMRGSGEVTMELYPLSGDDENIFKLSEDMRKAVRGKFAGKMV